MRVGVAIGATLALVLVMSLGSCASETVGQGEVYLPNGELPLGTPSVRADAGCDGGCDAGVDAGPPVPLPSGAVAPTNTCATARAIGTVSGDTDRPAVTASGSCSEWLSLRVTENDSSAFGTGMKLTLTLTPTGGDFELYAYFNADRDEIVCTTPTASSFNVGLARETIALTWGEGTVANASDDGRTVGIAVVRTGGPCSSSASYVLTAEGHR